MDKVLIWKPARSDDLVTIQSQLHLVSLKYKGAANWTITSSGSYAYAATYNEVRVKRVGGGLVEVSLVSASYS